MGPLKCTYLSTLGSSGENGPGEYDRLGFCWDSVNSLYLRAFSLIIFFLNAS